MVRQSHVRDVVHCHVPCDVSGVMRDVVNHNAMMTDSAAAKRRAAGRERPRNRAAAGICSLRSGGGGCFGRITGAMAPHATAATRVFFSIAMITLLFFLYPGL